VLTGFGLTPNLVPLTRLSANIAGIQTGSRDNFEDMNRFIEAHRITPVVDRVFPFDEALQAFATWPSNAISGSWSSKPPQS
jgi:NADPH:quinone reductase-like Zn-dependent oxidoreductase